MKKPTDKKNKPLFFCFQHNDGMTAGERNHCLRRSLLVIMLLLTLIPLAITAGLSFFQYRQLLQEETSNNARWSAEATGKSLETNIQKLQASIRMLADAYPLDALAQQENFALMFRKLKSEYPGVVDLSIIAPDGVQRAYVGPYNLTGKNYSNSTWYQDALVDKNHVSEAFLGFRNVPHFVITASRKEAGQQGSWILRTSIDCSTLDHFLASIRPESAEDAFLLDRNGTLQSSSRFYGKVNDHFDLFDLEKLTKKSTIALRQGNRNGEKVLWATVAVRDTPWFLVLEQRGYVHQSNWVSFKKQLLLIFTFCLALTSLSVIKISGMLARKIREADETREALISETEHTNKLASIGRLAAGVAHEINNPLAIINEKAGLMKDLIEISKDFQYRDKFLHLLTTLQNAVTRSRTITHRLLGFTRRMDVSLESVQVNRVIGEVLGFLEKEAQNRKIGFCLDLQEYLPPLMSDHGQLQQILLNVINNAIDAVEENGEIRIVTKDNNKLVQICIEDNGPGIPPEVLRNIFEPFFTTKAGNEKHGTGLGLFITYGLVKKLGGDITVNSTVGAGTTVQITFPLRPATAREALAGGDQRPGR